MGIFCVIGLLIQAYRYTVSTLFYWDEVFIAAPGLVTFKNSDFSLKLADDTKTISVKLEDLKQAQARITVCNPTSKELKSIQLPIALRTLYVSKVEHEGIDGKTIISGYELPPKFGGLGFIRPDSVITNNSPQFRYFVALAKNQYYQQHPQEFVQWSFSTAICDGERK
ncbi:MAG: hypothetical protein K8S54_10465 [Spirochaetia bacterium]|nr:hypothetical protein [Spirochaetia bacterium]